jgi:hypothetical protein
MIESLTPTTVPWVVASSAIAVFDQAWTGVVSMVTELIVAERTS